MTGSIEFDAIVIGSGPNGLAAAITLARAGHSVKVYEARDRVGGGARSAELTLPGFIHDICSAIHPLGLASPFFRELPLADYGLEWIQPPAAVAHPLDDGPAVLVQQSMEATGETLGPDAAAYRRLIQPIVDHWENLSTELLGPFPLLPHHPFLLANFGMKAILPATRLARSVFQGERARAMFAGMAAHSMLPLEKTVSSGFGLMMAGMAHVVGWPVARNGSQKISDALACYLEALGGKIQTGEPVDCIDGLPAARVYLFDTSPRDLIRIAGKRLPDGYKRRLERYRYGPGIFKIDYALDGPVPWKSPACVQTATVHVGGSMEEIAAAERAPWRGDLPEKPFVLVAQQSLYDPTRAPAGRQTLWAYCHVPNGSTADMTERIESQIERFAPGFRDRVLERVTHNSADYERYNPNYVGGDINTGVQDLFQFFTRPVARPVPYSTPANDIFLCSSATPPGGGVHGMCGYHAARAAMKRLRKGK